MEFIDLDQPSEMNSPGADSANGLSGSTDGGSMNSPHRSAYGSSGPSGALAAADFSIRSPQFSGSMKSPDIGQSRTIQNLLNRVLDSNSSLASRQSELMARIQEEFASIPRQAVNVQVGTRRSAASAAAPSARSEGPRANYRPWGETIKQPHGMDAAKGMKRAAAEAGNGSEQLPGSGPSGRVKTTTAMPSPLNLPCGPLKMKSPDSSIGSMASPQRDVRIQAMQHIHQKITNHENKHAAILNDSRTSDAKPQLTYQQGSDGRKYATAGEVNADLSPVPGKPHATEKKAESVYRSALHDSERSSEDDEAGRKAMFASQSARYEAVRKRMAKGFRNTDESGAKIESPYNRQPVSMSSPANSGSQSNQSPHDVKMKFPAAPFIAAGARFIGGAIARGAIGRRAAIIARRAGRFFKGPATSGAGLFFSNKSPKGNVLESRADMLARHFRSLEGSSDRLNVSFGSMADRLKSFSPDIAIQNAFNNLNRTTQNIRQAQQIGKPLAEFEKQRGRIEIAGRETFGNIAEVLLPLFNTAAKVGADVAEIVAWISSFATVIAPITKSIDDNSALILDSLRAGFGILGAILPDVRHMRRLAQERALKDQKAGSAANLNAFFGMQIPGPKDKPNLAPNPNFNMPVFLANPQQNLQLGIF
jgi:hypothetical protein